MIEYKFGKLGSVVELNELAENLANEGDEGSLRTLAQENGIEDFAVDRYLMGDNYLLATQEEAALGRIEVEEADLKPQDLLKDWVEYLKGQIPGREDLQRAVMQKDKDLRGMIGHLLAWSFKHQHEIDKDIVKAAGVSAGRVTFGIPGMGTAKKLIREYYLEAGK